MIFLVVQFLTVVAVFGKKYEKSEGVYVLTDKNYEAAVAEFEYLLVYFYAPWYVWL